MKHSWQGVLAVQTVKSWPVTQKWPLKRHSTIPDINSSGRWKRYLYLCCKQKNEHYTSEVLNICVLILCIYAMCSKKKVKHQSQQKWVVKRNRWAKMHPLKGFKKHHFTSWIQLVFLSSSPDPLVAVFSLRPGNFAPAFPGRWEPSKAPQLLFKVVDSVTK